jgi:hypothetical protein
MGFQLLGQHDAEARTMVDWFTVRAEPVLFERDQ